LVVHHEDAVWPHQYAGSSAQPFERLEIIRELRGLDFDPAEIRLSLSLRSRVNRSQRKSDYHRDRRHNPGSVHLRFSSTDDGPAPMSCQRAKVYLQLLKHSCLC
jgi:hypothetical protein